MSEQNNEATHDETAAVGDAARRSSAEAAALTAGSTSSEQQLHSGSASRLSPKVKGGITEERMAPSTSSARQPKSPRADWILTAYSSGRIWVSTRMLVCIRRLRPS